MLLPRPKKESKSCHQRGQIYVEAVANIDNNDATKYQSRTVGLRAWSLPSWQNGAGKAFKSQENITIEVAINAVQEYFHLSY